MGIVAQRGGQAGADGSEQCQASDGDHQLARECGQQPGHYRTEQADDDVQRPAGHGSRVATRPVLVRLRPHAHGSGDRTEVQGIGPERCQRQGGQTGHGQEAGHRQRVAGGPDDGHPRKILRCHGDHEKRQRQADDCGRGELRDREDRDGPGEVDGRQRYLALSGRERDGGSQREHDGVARQPAACDEVAEKHQQDQRQCGLGRHEGLHAEPRQHAGQQRGGDLCRDAVHGALEPARGASKGDEHGAQHEGAYRLSHGVAACQACRRQHRSTGRGPGDHHRLAQEQ